jgi:hypothetical protein
MADFKKYRFTCTLSYGDIYGQIIVWLGVIFVSLAAALAGMGSNNPIFALVTVGLIWVVSLPFLLFAFVTTLFNHIEIDNVSEQEEVSTSTAVFSRVQPQGE